MAQALALAARQLVQPLEALRIVLVSGCAIALIAAGQVFPL